MVPEINAHTFSFLEMSYALVAGYDADDPKSTQKTEVLYVNGTTKICNSTANYPENIFGLSGGSFLKNNLIVACGGDDKKQTSACYSMSNDLKWTHFANLTTIKYDIASAFVTNGLWVTGNGRIGYYSILEPFGKKVTVHRC